MTNKTRKNRQHRFLLLLLALGSTYRTLSYTRMPPSTDPSRSSKSRCALTEVAPTDSRGSQSPYDRPPSAALPPSTPPPPPPPDIPWASRAVMGTRSSSLAAAAPPPLFQLRGNWNAPDMRLHSPGPGGDRSDARAFLLLLFFLDLDLAFFFLAAAAASRFFRFSRFFRMRTRAWTESSSMSPWARSRMLRTSSESMDWREDELSPSDESSLSSELSSSSESSSPSSESESSESESESSSEESSSSSSSSEPMT
mmetsp:Transcript_16764/g.48270  ORF Transcript_16764/g.48270 Transcript_16764/m.48270 type:complete len:254 (+) Transcript_16764:1168-1929(+)